MSISDPDISVRRKAVFIMGTLLRSNHVSNLDLPSQNNTPTPTASPNLTSADNPIPSESVAPAEPIHPNSHAANLKDPSRIATSKLTLDAMRTHHIADYVVNSIINFLPYGEDGNLHAFDLDYEEKAMRLVHAYVVTYSAELSDQQKKALSEYLRICQRKYDKAYLLDKFGLSPEEYTSLVGRINQ